MWPDDELKKLPNFLNIAQKLAKSFLQESCIF